MSQQNKKMLLVVFGTGGVIARMCARAGGAGARP